MEVFLRRGFINALFIIALAVITVNNIIAYRQGIQSIDSTGWVEHTHKVIDTANKVLTTLTEAGFSANQYILSGDKIFLNGFQKNIQAGKQNIDQIKELTKDNPLQQTVTNDLELLISQRAGIMESIVNTFAQGDKTDAVKIAVSEQRIKLKNEVELLLNRIIDEEKRLLIIRNKTTNRDIHNTNLLFIAGGTISELLLIFSMILLNYYSIYREQLERKKQESEKFIQLLLQNIPDYGIFMLDPQGNVKTWNQGAERIKGYKPEEIIGQHFSKFYTMEDREHLRPDHVLELAKEQGRYEDEDWRVRKDGSKFWADVIITPIYDNSAHLLGFSKVTRDLTDRKKVEKMKNEFVSVVSHELRTPLTSIKGSLSLVLANNNKLSPEKSKELLKIASANCDRLTMLINDLLDFEKLEAGKMQFNFQNVNIGEVISEAVENNQMYGNKFGIKIVALNILSDSFVNVDKARLIQVLTNLISNAVKFAKPGTNVILSMEKINNSIKIAVTNQGEGIPEVFKSKIFQRFSQADASIARREGGTGLGLAISKSMIEKMGGRINFTSEANKETTFYIEFPLSMTTLPLTQSMQDRKQFSNRVLICEDDVDQANYLSRLIQNAGYQTDICLTGTNAKRLLADNEYYALLLDLILPDMNGIELIKELRHLKDNYHVPIIITSIIANESRDLLNGNAIEVVDWLEKPIDFNKLSKAFSVIRDARQKKSPSILHVEDDVDVQNMIENLLKARSELSTVDSLKGATKLLNTRNFDLIILDLILTDGNGAELLPLISSKGIPVIIFSRNQLDQKNISFVKEMLIKSKTTPQVLLEKIDSILNAAK